MMGVRQRRAAKGRFLLLLLLLLPLLRWGCGLVEGVEHTPRIKRGAD